MSKPAFQIEFSHEAVDAFWKVWMEVGEPHKHGVYESTWMAFRAAMNAKGEDQRAAADSSQEHEPWDSIHGPDEECMTCGGCGYDGTCPECRHPYHDTADSRQESSDE